MTFWCRRKTYVVSLVSVKVKSKTGSFIRVRHCHEAALSFMNTRQDFLCLKISFEYIVHIYNIKSVFSPKILKLAYKISRPFRKLALEQTITSYLQWTTIGPLPVCCCTRVMHFIISRRPTPLRGMERSAQSVKWKW